MLIKLFFVSCLLLKMSFKKVRMLVSDLMVSKNRFVKLHNLIFHTDHQDV